MIGQLPVRRHLDFASIPDRLNEPACRRITRSHHTGAVEGFLGSKLYPGHLRLIPMAGSAPRDQQRSNLRLEEIGSARRLRLNATKGKEESK